MRSSNPKTVNFLVFCERTFLRGGGLLFKQGKEKKGKEIKLWVCNALWLVRPGY